MDGEIEITPEELEELESAGLGYPKKGEKEGILAFFKKVLSTKDNTKTGNVNEEELGFVRLPVRTNLELDNYCRTMGMKGLADYFQDKAQIVSSSSLSKEGFLDKLVVTQKRESELKQRRFSNAQKKNWFGRKEQTVTEGGI